MAKNLIDVRITLHFGPRWLFSFLAMITRLAGIDPVSIKNYPHKESRYEQPVSFDWLNHRKEKR